MNLMQPHHIHFLPWIGSKYPKSSLKLLVLGESHYSDERQRPDFTRREIKGYVEGRFNYRFWTQIGQVITGKPHWEINRASFWSGIAFYNYVQEIAVNAARQPPLIQHSNDPNTRSGRFFVF